MLYLKAKQSMALASFVFEEERKRLPAPAAPIQERVDLQISTRATLTAWVTLEGAAVGPVSDIQEDWLRPTPERTLEDMAIDGMLALETLRHKRPLWFRANLAYPEEDFTGPDFSGIRVDLSN
jgi:hypothetical protein